MNFKNTDQVIIGERKNYLKPLIIILLIIIITVGLFTSHTQYVKNTNIVSVETIPEFTSTGLDEIVTETSTPVGSIFYSAVRVVEGNQPAEIYTYKYDVVNKISALTTNNPTLSALPLSSETSLILEKGKDKNTYNLSLHNLTTNKIEPLKIVTAEAVRDLAVSTNGLMYAYSFLPDGATSTNSDSMDDWSLVIGTDMMGSEITIPAASEPKWVDNNTAVLYMKTDGLYQINLATNVIERVMYLPTLYMFDDFAINTDSTTVVLVRQAISEINVLSVTKNDNGELAVTKTGKITGDKISYSNPIFTPAGDYYGVMATKIVDYEIVGQSINYKSESKLEVRHNLSSKIIQSYNIEDPENIGVTLLGWIN